MEPYGYHIERAKAYAVEEERVRLVKLFKAYAMGLPLKACMKEAGIDRCPATCKDMLSNRTYLGTDYYPPIISQELFDAVQEEMKRRTEGRRKKASTKRLDPVHVYTGFMVEGKAPQCDDPKENAIKQFNRIKTVW